MFKNEVILFPPYDDKIECNYSNFNKIVFQKVSDMIRNPEIREQYERFSCNYHYFYPQLEFLIYEMKYEYYDGLLFDGKANVHREEDNYKLWCEKYSNNNGINVFKSDNENIYVRKFIPSEFDAFTSGFIDKYGNILSSRYSDNTKILAFQIISQHLMHNLDLVYRFMNYQNHSDFSIYEKFCYDIGYVYFKDNNLFYNENALSKAQKLIINQMRKR